jgi:hypothetical protein
MQTNLMQLRRLVRARVGVPISDDFLPDHVLDDHINLACQTIDAEARWPWNEVGEIVTLTPTAPDIVPTADWRATRAILYKEHELNLVAPSDMLKMLEWGAATPDTWCPLGEVITVRPKPSSPIEVNHYYYRQCVWLADDGDVPSIPGDYTGAIVAKAAELLATRESSGGDVERHGAEYTKWMARMRRDARRSTSGVHVRVRPGGWI